METKNKQVIRHRHDFTLQESDLEKGGGKIVTVPNESLTMRQIFERFAKGQATGGRGFTFHGQEGSYTMDERSVDFDAPDLEKVVHMDPVEREQLAHETKVKRKSLEGKYLDDQKQRDQKLQQQKVDEENALLEKLSKKVQGGAKSADSGGSKRPTGAQE